VGKSRSTGPNPRSATLLEWARVGTPRRLDQFGIGVVVFGIAAAVATAYVPESNRPSHRQSVLHGLTILGVAVGAALVVAALYTLVRGAVDERDELRTILARAEAQNESMRGSVLHSINGTMGVSRISHRRSRSPSSKVGTIEVDVANDGPLPVEICLRRIAYVFDHITGAEFAAPGPIRHLWSDKHAILAWEVLQPLPEYFAGTVALTVWYGSPHADERYERHWTWVFRCAPNAGQPLDTMTYSRLTDSHDRPLPKGYTFQTKGE
jgi:hypothetical protein